MMSYKASLGHVVDRAYFYSEFLRSRVAEAGPIPSGCVVLADVDATYLR